MEVELAEADLGLVLVEVLVVRLVVKLVAIKATMVAATLNEETVAIDQDLYASSHHMGVVAMRTSGRIARAEAVVVGG